MCYACFAICCGVREFSPGRGRFFVRAFFRRICERLLRARSPTFSSLGVSLALRCGLFWAARRCSPLSPRRKGFSFSLVKIMRTTCSGFNLLGVFFSLRARRIHNIFPSLRPGIQLHRESIRAGKGYFVSYKPVHGVLELAAWRVCCPLLRRTGRPLSFKIDFS